MYLGNKTIMSLAALRLLALIFVPRVAMRYDSAAKNFGARLQLAMSVVGCKWGSIGYSRKSKKTEFYSRPIKSGRRVPFLLLVHKKCSLHRCFFHLPADVTAIPVYLHR